uniref:Uncharacterized protein n=1 Tax=viral metagenome TaxID=1070528 RepID=A0A6C0H9N6_9ZZZZ
MGTDDRDNFLYGFIFLFNCFIDNVGLDLLLNVVGVFGFFIIEVVLYCILLFKLLINFKYLILYFIYLFL